MEDGKFGQGIPKICIPVVEETQAGILAAAEKLRHSVADLVEWRADYYEDLQSFDQLRETIEKLGQALDDKALLFTVRTKEEGGEIALSFAEYSKILEEASSCPEVQYTDVEMFRGMHTKFQDSGGQTGRDGNVWERVEDSAYEPVKRLLKKLHDRNVTVIGSYHDFEKTPSAAEIVSRLVLMRKLGADIPKIAVMPQQQEDVLQLLAATWEAKKRLDPVPVITMSMGSRGRISRIAGESFGSAVTFGCIGKPSAPGQMEAEQLKQILTILHESK